MEESLLNEMKQFATDEFKNIDKEREKCRNKPFAFCGLGEMGENLLLEMFPKSFGSGSKGGIAYDNIELNTDRSIKFARECKTCSLNGTKECISKKCKGNHKTGYKAPTFQPTCTRCGESKFKSNNDSRLGICTKAHKEYAIDLNILKEYIFILIKYISESDSITIHCCKIMCDNEYCTDYLLNQLNSGSKNTCNCLPYSIDFNLSGPITLFNIELFRNDEHKIHYYNLDNTKHDDIPLHNKNTGQKLKYKFNGDVNPFEHFNKDSLNYDEMIHMFKLKSGRPNCLGKARGKVCRK